MNYGELVAEVATRAGETGFTLRAAQHVTQAETDLRQNFLPIEYPDLESVVTADTNWLLRDNQEIYIAAVLKQFYLFKLDAERAAALDTYMQSLISARKVADRIRRYAGEAQAIPGAHP